MPQIIHESVTVRILSPEQRIYTPKSLRRAFRAFATEMTIVPFHGYDRVIIRKLMEGFEVINIVPQRLGGQDNYENLALCEPELHRLIDAFIDKQVAGLPIGKEVNIKIPNYPKKVWGLTEKAIVACESLRPPHRERAYELLELTH